MVKALVEPGCKVTSFEVNLRIAHLRIGYLVGNPEVGNPDPYQSLGLPTSIIPLFLTVIDSH